MYSIIDTKYGPLYFVEKSRKGKKNISIRISADGEVTVSKPLRMASKDIHVFVMQHTDWIYAHVGKIVCKKYGPIPTKEYFLYMSEEKKFTKQVYVEKKNEALQILKQEVEEVNKIYQFRYTAVRVKNQKSRWGSCSRKGVLNFNYKVAYVSPQQKRYIVAHELCHLKEFNHGANFWKLVSIVVPDYKEVRKGLKVL